jgi:hypothetical protein
LRWEAPPPEVAPEWDGDGAARPSMRGGEGGGSRSFGGLGFWWRSGSGNLPRRSFRCSWRGRRVENDSDSGCLTRMWDRRG